jgi:hypothetical protein
MSNDSAARVLTIIGLIFNGLALAIVLLDLMMIVPLLALLGSDPLLASLAMFSLEIMAGELLLTLIVGLILPLVAYGKIRPDSKGAAAGILVVSGAIGLLFIGIIGGILILIAGALVATWHPLGAEHYGPMPVRSLGPPSPMAGQPGAAPGATLATPKGAKYCVTCGAELQGDERYCPVCGNAIG